jgi:hypothetical protein
VTLPLRRNETEIREGRKWVTPAVSQPKLKQQLKNQKQVFS